MSLEILVIPCLKDNYAYLVKTDQACAVVDPSEAAPVMAALDEQGWTLTHILNTHHHPDHTGGNLALKKSWEAQIVGPAKDAARIPGIDIGVTEAGWHFGGYDVAVLEVPGHTRGAITFVIDGDAFTGDTLFSIGCGRLFEGDAETMWNSLGKLMALPDTTRIWCGHEYTQNNIRFALTLEPHNKALNGFADAVKLVRKDGKPSMPSTIAMEKMANPFLRPDSEEIRKTLGMPNDSDVAVFGEIRRRKDSF